MQRHLERDLEILTAIAEGLPLTQRDLARHLGVALGLTNLYLKRLARKGFIKITEFPRKPSARKRLRYLLTSKGLSEKSRLTYEHVAYSLNLYRRARRTLRDSLSHLTEVGMKRVALYGTGEAAELAYLTLREIGLEPVGVFAPERGGHFVGLPVQALTELDPSGLDALIVASFDRPERQVTEVTQAGFPAEKVLTLRRIESPGTGGEAKR